MDLLTVLNAKDFEKIRQRFERAEEEFSEVMDRRKKLQLDVMYSIASGGGIRTFETKEEEEKFHKDLQQRVAADDTDSKSAGLTKPQFILFFRELLAEKIEEIEQIESKAREEAHQKSLLGKSKSWGSARSLMMSTTTTMSRRGSLSSSRRSPTQQQQQPQNPGNSINNNNNASTTSFASASARRKSFVNFKFGDSTTNNDDDDDHNNDLLMTKVDSKNNMNNDDDSAPNMPKWTGNARSASIVSNNNNNENPNEASDRSVLPPSLFQGSTSHRQSSGSINNNNNNNGSSSLTRRPSFTKGPSSSSMRALSKSGRRKSTVRGSDGLTDEELAKQTINQWGDNALAHLFHDIDYNGDGTVSFDEFTTFCVATFAHHGSREFLVPPFKEYSFMSIPHTFEEQADILRSIHILSFNNVNECILCESYTSKTLHKSSDGKKICELLIDGIIQAAVAVPGAFVVSTSSNQLLVFDSPSIHSEKLPPQKPKFIFHVWPVVTCMVSLPNPNTATHYGILLGDRRGVVRRVTLDAISNGITAQHHLGPNSNNNNENSNSNNNNNTNTNTSSKGMASHGGGTFMANQDAFMHHYEQHLRQLKNGGKSLGNAKLKNVTSRLFQGTISSNGGLMTNMIGATTGGNSNSNNNNNNGSGNSTSGGGGASSGSSTTVGGTATYFPPLYAFSCEAPKEMLEMYESWNAKKKGGDPVNHPLNFQKNNNNHQPSSLTSTAQNKDITPPPPGTSPSLPALVNPHRSPQHGKLDLNNNNIKSTTTTPRGEQVNNNNTTAASPLDNTFASLNMTHVMNKKYKHKALVSTSQLKPQCQVTGLVVCGFVNVTDALSETLRALVSLSTSNIVGIFDTKQGVYSGFIKTPLHSPVREMKLCERAQLAIFAGVSDRKLATSSYDTASPKCSFLDDVEAPHHESIVSVCSPAGTYQICSIDLNGTIKLWDARSFKLVASWKMQRPLVLPRTTPFNIFSIVAHEKRGHIIALSGIVCHTFEYDKRRTVTFAHDQPISKILFNPVMQTAISVSQNEIRTWSLTNGRCICSARVFEGAHQRRRRQRQLALLLKQRKKTKKMKIKQHQQEMLGPSGRTRKGHPSSFADDNSSSSNDSENSSNDNSGSDDSWDSDEESVIGDGGGGILGDDGENFGLQRHTKTHDKLPRYLMALTRSNDRHSLTRKEKRELKKKQRQAARTFFHGDDVVDEQDDERRKARADDKRRRNVEKLRQKEAAERKRNQFMESAKLALQSRRVPTSSTITHGGKKSTSLARQSSTMTATPAHGYRTDDNNTTSASRLDTAGSNSAMMNNTMTTNISNSSNYPKLTMYQQNAHDAIANAEAIDNYLQERAALEQPYITFVVQEKYTQRQLLVGSSHGVLCSVLTMTGRVLWKRVVRKGKPIAFVLQAKRDEAIVGLETGEVFSITYDVQDGVLVNWLVTEIANTPYGITNATVSSPEDDLVAFSPLPKFNRMELHFFSVHSKAFHVSNFVALSKHDFGLPDTVTMPDIVSIVFYKNTDGSDFVVESTQQELYQQEHEEEEQIKKTTLTKSSSMRKTANDILKRAASATPETGGTSSPGLVRAKSAKFGDLINQVSQTTPKGHSSSQPLSVFSSGGDGSGDDHHSDESQHHLSSLPPPALHAASSSGPLLRSQSSRALQLRMEQDRLEVENLSSQMKSGNNNSTIHPLPETSSSPPTTPRSNNTNQKSSHHNNNNNGGVRLLAVVDSHGGVSIWQVGGPMIDEYDSYAKRIIRLVPPLGLIVQDVTWVRRTLLVGATDKGYSCIWRLDEILGKTRILSQSMITPVPEETILQYYKQGVPRLVVNLKGDQEMITNIVNLPASVVLAGRLLKQTSGGNDISAATAGASVTSAATTTVGMKKDNALGTIITRKLSTSVADFFGSYNKDAFDDSNSDNENDSKNSEFTLEQVPEENMPGQQEKGRAIVIVASVEAGDAQLKLYNLPNGECLGSCCTGAGSNAADDREHIPDFVLDDALDELLIERRRDVLRAIREGEAAAAAARKKRQEEEEKERERQRIMDEERAEQLKQKKKAEQQQQEMSMSNSKRRIIQITSPLQSSLNNNAKNKSNENIKTQQQQQGPHASTSVFGEYFSGSQNKSNNKNNNNEEYGQMIELIHDNEEEEEKRIKRQKKLQQEEEARKKLEVKGSSAQDTLVDQVRERKPFRPIQEYEEQTPIIIHQIISSDRIINAYQNEIPLIRQMDKDNQKRFGGLDDESGQNNNNNNNNSRMFDSETGYPMSTRQMVPGMLLRRRKAHQLGLSTLSGAPSAYASINIEVSDASSNHQYQQQQQQQQQYFSNYNNIGGDYASEEESASTSTQQQQQQNSSEITPTTGTPSKSNSPSFGRPNNKNKANSGDFTGLTTSHSSGTYLQNVTSQTVFSSPSSSPQQQQRNGVTTTAVNDMTTMVIDVTNEDDDNDQDPKEAKFNYSKSANSSSRNNRTLRNLGSGTINRKNKNNDDDDFFGEDEDEDEDAEDFANAVPLEFEGHELPTRRRSTKFGASSSITDTAPLLGLNQSNTTLAGSGSGNNGGDGAASPPQSLMRRTSSMQKSLSSLNINQALASSNGNLINNTTLGNDNKKKNKNNSNDNNDSSSFSPNGNNNNDLSSTLLGLTAPEVKISFDSSTTVPTSGSVFHLPELQVEQPQQEERQQSSTTTAMTSQNTKQNAESLGAGLGDMSINSNNNNNNFNNDDNKDASSILPLMKSADTSINNNSMKIMTTSMNREPTGKMKQELSSSNLNLLSIAIPRSRSRASSVMSGRSSRMSSNSMERGCSFFTMNDKGSFAQGSPAASHLGEKERLEKIRRKKQSKRALALAKKVRSSHKKQLEARRRAEEDEYNAKLKYHQQLLARENSALHLGRENSDLNNNNNQEQQDALVVASLASEELSSHQNTGHAQVAPAWFHTFKMPGGWINKASTTSSVSSNKNNNNKNNNLPPRDAQSSLQFKNAKQRAKEYELVSGNQHVDGFAKFITNQIGRAATPPDRLTISRQQKRLQRRKERAEEIRARDKARVEEQLSGGYRDKQQQKLQLLTKKQTTTTTTMSKARSPPLMKKRPIHRRRHHYNNSKNRRRMFGLENDDDSDADSDEQLLTLAIRQQKNRKRRYHQSRMNQHNNSNNFDIDNDDDDLQDEGEDDFDDVAVEDLVTQRKLASNTGIFSRQFQSVVKSEARKAVKKAERIMGQVRGDPSVSNVVIARPEEENDEYEQKEKEGSGNFDHNHHQSGEHHTINDDNDDDQQQGQHQQPILTFESASPPQNPSISPTSHHHHSHSHNNKKKQHTLKKLATVMRSGIRLGAITEDGGKKRKDSLKRSASLNRMISQDGFSSDPDGNHPGNRDHLAAVASNPLERRTATTLRFDDDDDDDDVQQQYQQHLHRLSVSGADNSLRSVSSHNDLLQASTSSDHHQHHVLQRQPSGLPSSLTNQQHSSAFESINKNKVLSFAQKKAQEVIRKTANKLSAIGAFSSGGGGGGDRTPTSLSRAASKQQLLTTPNASTGKLPSFGTNEELDSSRTNLNDQQQQQPFGVVSYPRSRPVTPLKEENNNTHENDNDQKQQQKQENSLSALASPAPRVPRLSVTQQVDENDENDIEKQQDKQKKHKKTSNVQVVEDQHQHQEQQEREDPNWGNRYQNQPQQLEVSARSAKLALSEIRQKLLRDDESKLKKEHESMESRLQSRRIIARLPDNCISTEQQQNKTADPSSFQSHHQHEKKELPPQPPTLSKALREMRMQREEMKNKSDNNHNDQQNQEQQQQQQPSSSSRTVSRRQSTTTSTATVSALDKDFNKYLSNAPNSTGQSFGKSQQVADALSPFQRSNQKVFDTTGNDDDDSKHSSDNKSNKKNNDVLTNWETREEVQSEEGEGTHHQEDNGNPLGAEAARIGIDVSAPTHDRYKRRQSLYLQSKDRFVAMKSTGAVRIMDKKDNVAKDATQALLKKKQQELAELNNQPSFSNFLPPAITGEQQNQQQQKKHSLLASSGMSHASSSMSHSQMMSRSLNSTAETIAPDSPRNFSPKKEEDLMITSTRSQKQREFEASASSRPGSGGANKMMRNKLNNSVTDPLMTSSLSSLSTTKNRPGSGGGGGPEHRVPLQPEDSKQFSSKNDDNTSNFNDHVAVSQPHNLQRQREDPSLLASSHQSINNNSNNKSKTTTTTTNIHLPKPPKSIPSRQEQLLQRQREMLQQQDHQQKEHSTSNNETSQQSSSSTTTALPTSARTLPSRPILSRNVAKGYGAASSSSSSARNFSLSSSSLSKRK